MGPELIVGVLVGFLLASLAGNLVQWRAGRAQVAHWRFNAAREADARHAQEVRSARELHDLVERIGTSPRIELREHKPAPVDPDTPKYISDEAYHDEAWNEWTGEPEEAEQQ